MCVIGTSEARERVNARWGPPVLDGWDGADGRGSFEGRAEA